MAASAPSALYCCSFRYFSRSNARSSAAATADLDWPEAERAQVLLRHAEGITVAETETGLRVTAVGRSAHGSKPELGISAVTRLAAVFDGGKPFATVTDTLPPWLHNPNWNILRLTGRGTDELAESLVLSFNGTAFCFR